MSLVVGASLLSLLAIVVVMWRVKFRISGAQHFEGDFNRSLYLEKVAQLDAQFEAGEIDQVQHEQLKLEYQRQFIADNPAEDESSAATTGKGKWLPVVVALSIPFIAVFLYLQMGASDAVTLRQLLEKRSQVYMETPHESGQLQYLTYQVVEQLKSLSEKHGEDPLYPVLLAQLYMDQGEFGLAVPRYRQAVTLMPEAPDIRAEYAQALFFAANNQVTDEMIQQAELALRLQPDNQTALGLMGIGNFHRENYREAIRYWQQALSLLPPMSASRGSLEAGIAAARERLGEAPDQGAEGEKIAGGAALEVSVAASEAIDLPGDTTVFIYARAWQGSPMPLAIRKITLADLPVTVTLDDSMAMSPAANLSSADKIELIARVSRSGAPVPASGDWQASSDAIELNGAHHSYSLLIDQRIP